MSGVSKEQIMRAKAVPILEYILASEPHNVKRKGNTYRLKDHDSLEISNGLWHWHSREIGGKNVIDYLVKVRGFSFVDAVKHLAGDDVSRVYPVPVKKAPLERKPFILPSRNKDNKRVIAYLEGRGIDKRLILDCIAQGSLYESAHWHNCVFLGRDENGKARCASLRGTMGDFKCDVSGSEKQYGFTLPPTNVNSDTVAVFESAVDALSHQTLNPDFSGWRLSLDCVALAALTSFLERHSEVKTVVICTDNDKAGDIAAAQISQLQGITAARSPPLAGYKDWNDSLIAVKNKSKPSLIRRLEAAKTTVAESSGFAEKERKGDKSLCR